MTEIHKALNVYEIPRRDRPALKSKHLHQFDREFLKASDARPEMSVLEIGCGTGIFLRYLVRRGFKDITALDSDAGLAPVLDDLTGIPVLFGDGSALLDSMGAERFDRIALFDVAEHIPVEHLMGLMARLRVALKPGGKVVMRVPNCSSPWGMKCYFGSFDHVTPFTPERFEQLAAASGFKLVKVFGSDTGTGIRKLAQTALHWLLDRCLVYHPDYWEVCLIGVLEKA